MRGYSEQEVFGGLERNALLRAQAIVEQLPERDVHGERLRCHEVARVVGDVLGLEVVDGRYEVGAEHSWLVFSFSRSILDPYVVGRIPLVQLVANVLTMPHRYTPGPPRDDVRRDVVRGLLHLKGLKSLTEPAP